MSDKKTISVDSIRKNIIEAINSKLKMSVKDFAESPKPKEFGIEASPLTIRNYLSTGAVSFAFLHKMYRALGLGVLDRDIKVVREVSYTVKSKPSKNEESK